MNINRILEGLSNALDAGNQEQIQAETITPTFVPQSETNSTEKRGERQLYGDYQRNQIQSRWLEAQPQQDNFEQKAKELIEKYTPKNVVLVGKFDSKGLGAELAALVPKGAKLGTAVFAQLSAGDKADVARAMIDNLNDETLKRMAQTTNGKALLEQTAGLLDGKTTNMWDLRSFAGGDTERKARIETAFGKLQVEQKPEAQKVENAANNGEFKGITEDQLLKLAPSLKKNPARLKEYTQLLNETMKQSNINTPAQQAAFIATCAAETIGFTAMTEGDSNYASSKSKYKGRGIIQLTHEENYLAASQYLKLGSPDTKPPYRLLVDKPELAAKNEYSFKIAGWFWPNESTSLVFRLKKSANNREAICATSAKPQVW